MPRTDSTTCADLLQNLMVVTDKRVLFLSRTWRFGRRTGGTEEAFHLEDLKVSASNMWASTGTPQTPDLQHTVFKIAADGALHEALPAPVLTTQWLMQTHSAQKSQQVENRLSLTVCAHATPCALQHVTLLHGETHCGCKGLKQHGTLTLDFSTEGNVMSWQGQMANSTGVKVTGCTRKIKVNLDGAQKAYNYLQVALLEKRQVKAKAAH